MAKVSNDDFIMLLNRLKAYKGKDKKGFENTQNEIISHIEAGRVDVNAVDNFGRSMLVICAREGFNEIGKLLLRSGADANYVCSCNGKKQTALMFAIAEDNIDMVWSLLIYGANVNFEDSEGNTPLMYAVNYSSDGIVSTLLSSGADINAQNAEGDTALHQAVDFGEVSFASCLIHNGAYADIKNKKGKCAEELIDEKIKKGTSDSKYWAELKKEIVNAKILNSNIRRFNPISI